MGFHRGLGMEVLGSGAGLWLSVSWVLRLWRFWGSGDTCSAAVGLVSHWEEHLGFCMCFLGVSSRADLASTGCWHCKRQVPCLRAALPH